MNLDNKKKRKKILNIVLGGGSILAMLGIIIYIQITINKDANKFYENSISSIIMNKGTDWLTGRANVFRLSDGLKIFLAFDKENQLSVGDSIYKKTNTYIYDVYRKMNMGNMSIEVLIILMKCIKYSAAQSLPTLSNNNK